MVGSRDLQPTVEDYHSDASERPVILESFRRSPAANVAAKRSHPSDLGAQKPVDEKMIHSDLQSDSGYSSHTAGTMSSADSVPSAETSQTPPTAPSSAASVPPPSPPVAKRRPTLVAEERKKSSQSPRKPLQRSGSSASKRPSGSRRPTVTKDERDCDDPNCNQCVPNPPPPPPRPRARRESTVFDSALDISHPPSDVRSQHSDPASNYTSLPSPTYSRQAAPYALGPAVVQPAPTRRQSLTTNRRPMSYHGDPGSDYWAQAMSHHSNTPQEHGPPPSMSAHYNMLPQHHSQMPAYLTGVTPPPQFFHGSHHMGQSMTLASSPYEQQRPQLSARTPSNSFQSFRSASGFGPTALGTYERPEPPMPSARYGNAPQSVRQDRLPALTQTPHYDDDDDDDESESSEFDYSDEEEEEEAPPPPPPPPPKQLMPPPGKSKSNKPKRDSRPLLPHAKTTQVYSENRLSQSLHLPERPREKDSRTPHISTVPSSRSTSVSRPPPRKNLSAYDAPQARPQAKVMVENPKSSRRQSYQAYPVHEIDYEKEERRQRRESRVYRDKHDDAIIVAERPPRQRAKSSTRRNEYMAETDTRRVLDNVEAYMQYTRGSNEPLSEHVHKAAKQRASRVPSDGASADERKTRMSQSNRTTMTSSGANGEIRLRVDASAPLSLCFNGDMEGRTLQINPAEDGMADIVIGGGPRDEEFPSHRSERSNALVPTRKSMLNGSARRDAEEISVKSSRSGQSRRERDSERRPLKRMTRYHQQSAAPDRYF